MGKGASSKARGLSNYRKATIRKSKLADYALHPIKSKGKAKSFNDLGYNMKNIKLLEKDIKNALKGANIGSFRKSKTGTNLYNVTINLKGPNNKIGEFTSIWETTSTNKSPNLVSIYKKKKEK